MGGVKGAQRTKRRLWSHKIAESRATRPSVSWPGLVIRDEGKWGAVPYLAAAKSASGHALMNRSTDTQREG